jgi:hypothetical protein
VSRPRNLSASLVLVALLAFAAALPGLGVRSTFGGHAAVDEPQYLLSALSLYEDGDLDIADELRGRRWATFHQAALPVQTAVLDGGRQLSPHDPLLPLLLAIPMGLGGWVGAKVAMAALAGALAALTVWVAVRRLHVPLSLAVGGVVVAAASPPLAVYATQVYPELPAALALLAGVAAVTGRLRPGALVAAGGAVVALPWLSVKYVPVAVVLAAVVLVRLVRGGRLGAAAGLLGALTGAAAAYLLVHRLIWGCWTVYASGDHFAASGEFGVVGVDPDYAGRSLRLVGLLADRAFGLVAWQPAWLLVVPALAYALRRRPAWLVPVAAPLAAGWLVATFVALTMHGFWWPGRQLVVVLPLALLVVLAGLARAGLGARAAATLLGGLGVLAYGWLLLDGLAGRLTWVSGFETVGDPAYAALRALLPDYRGSGAGLWLRHAAWAAALLALAVAGWRRGRSNPLLEEAPTPRPLTRSLTKGQPV